MKEKIFIFGASGHAKVVIDIVERQGLYEIAFLVDDDPALRGTGFFGYPVVGGKGEALARENAPSKAIVAIGNNLARERISFWLDENGFRRVSAVHPSAQIGRGVQIGAGTVIMAGACINSDAVVGENVIVNTRASVDHDCVVGDNVHIAPAVTLCGSVNVGNCSLVCAGTVVIPNIKIGRNVIVGAGATVIKSITDGLTVVGTPAIPMSEK